MSDEGREEAMMPAMKWMVFRKAASSMVLWLSIPWLAVWSYQKNGWLGVAFCVVLGVLSEIASVVLSLRRWRRYSEKYRWHTANGYRAAHGFSSLPENQ